MAVIQDEDGKIITRGKNLRVIHDRARRLRFGTWIKGEARTLSVRFRDGSFSRVVFADAGVLAGYVRDRIKFGRGKFEAWPEKE